MLTAPVAGGGWMRLRLSLDIVGVGVVDSVQMVWFGPRRVRSVRRVMFDASSALSRIVPMMRSIFRMIVRLLSLRPNVCRAAFSSDAPSSGGNSASTSLQGVSETNALSLSDRSILYHRLAKSERKRQEECERREASSLLMYWNNKQS